MTTSPKTTFVRKGATVVMERVTKSFGSRRVLGPIQIEIGEGEVVAWIGASGCGKTTLLRILAGLELPTEGRVTIGETSAREACRRQEIGVAFQRPALVPSRTALRNVEMTLEVCRRPEVLDPQRLLRDFGLEAFVQHYPHQLSGGMQQRVNIACAMVHHPRLLLLDEPFGALDELTRASMSAWLANVLLSTRQTAVLVTHSVEEAVILSDRIFIFSRSGRIAEIHPVKFRGRKSDINEEDLLREVARIRTSLHRVLEAEKGAME
jgi:NitT/TauT family transport system ATP-binding protein